MSIDLYTGVQGGGAVQQFYQSLKCCLDIEPSLKGAAMIASLFEAVAKAGGL
jgi:hypothetical protein